jgi:putative transposase
MAAEHIPVEVACRVLDVSVSGYDAWRSRPPSERAIRHAWLTDLIVKVHQDFRGTYGRCGCTPSCVWATGSQSATTPSPC